jgi:glycosyltransferase involved in cell wall biosynthesis
MKKISIVIPAYNEEKAIGHTLKEINDTLKNINIDYEIIVIDNNSIDRTGDIAKDLGAHVILEKRQGYGTTGISRSAGSRVDRGRGFLLPGPLPPSRRSSSWMNRPPAWTRSLR